jgi:hypothetical protein
MRAKKKGWTQRRALLSPGTCSDTPEATTSSTPPGGGKGTNTRTEYLGHVDIKNTERCTEVDTKRFRNFWK